MMITKKKKKRGKNKRIYEVCEKKKGMNKENCV